MPAFMLTMRSGRRYTVQADELRPGPDTVELFAQSVLIAMFDRSDVVSAVARENLLSEEPEAAAPHAVARHDPIPF